ncbi:N-acetylmuramoyl-L-alanine amidase [Mycolicibacterium komossense]|uniref:N-acetylmuramoyl-L-alanine amidase n=1 Tax=Mycolicibacterium komossense TaxID=1779 RepID=A0ABT3CIP1_9MYCO|nr:N-acetylmuramoyl-L-alanine amidase [Mycolicibacterium komossense]MCV7229081.1 N-acetylmuramoyl-L-alanine amidase [Mycolicibacterium komossense]
MDASEHKRSGDSPDAVTRRRLIQLAGGAALAATASACAQRLPPKSPPAPTASVLAVSAEPAQPPLAPAPVVTPAPVTADLLCRDAWRAQPARPGGVKHTINRMTLHHTAVVLGDNRLAPARLRQHQHYHQDQLGWIDIAYHVSVDRNGNIYELRDPTLVGDTATTYNPTGHFLVLCEGDFDQEDVTDEQLQGAAVAFAWATQNFQISTDTLGGHRNFADTACPGANLYAHVTSGDLRQRIEDLLEAGPVNLQKICGPEASDVVSRIEEGG